MVFLIYCFNVPYHTQIFYIRVVEYTYISVFWMLSSEIPPSYSKKYSIKVLSINRVYEDSFKRNRKLNNLFYLKILIKRDLLTRWKSFELRSFIKIFWITANTGFISLRVSSAVTLVILVKLHERLRNLQLNLRSYN